MKILLSILFLAFSSTALAASFIDRADFPTWAEEAIEKVNDEGIMTGYGDRLI